MDIVVRSTNLVDEASFWQAYLDAAKPEAADGVGRDLDAFRDPILGAVRAGRSARASVGQFPST
jgi:hypothetical protein